MKFAIKATLFCTVLALAGCEAPSVQTPQPEAPIAETTPNSAKKPTFENKGFFPKREEWKIKHFRNPNTTNGNITYFVFSRLALAASAECGVPLDFNFFDSAQAIGRRAIFQNKAAREARAKEALMEFEREYGPFDPNDPTLLCEAVARNKAEQTLFGAFFF